MSKSIAFSFINVCRLFVETKNLSKQEEIKIMKVHLISYLLFIVLLGQMELFAQNTKVTWSTFSIGYAELKSSNMVMKSVIGQPFVGTARTANNEVKSGFLTDTLFRRVPLAVNEREVLPTKFALEQNYPNPFNPSTKLKYQLPVDSRVTLKVYNVLGQVVATLADETQSAGYKTVEWNASNVASGVYFYKLETVGTSDHDKSFTQVKKMLLLK